MTHYLDIHLRPDPEFSVQHLMTAMYAKLHRALVRLGVATIGVSFPGQSEAAGGLGDTLRLLGPPSDLSQLMAMEWLNSMRDHVQFSVVAPVPPNAKFRTLRRIQAKSNPARIRRRQMHRLGLTEAEASAQLPNNSPKFLDLPFVRLTSTSTGQAFRLYLRLSLDQPAAQSGTFNAYGLSATATIPCF